MNEDKNLNQQTENYVDPRTIEPVVIGELRKEKIGKPILVFEMMLLFVIVLIGLPIVNNMLNDEESVLYRFIYGGSVPSRINNGEYEDKILDGSKIQALNQVTTMKFENLIIKNFKLNGTQIDCIMYSYNGVINLDNEELYLEVYSASEKLISSIKLSGSLDYQEKKVVLKAHGLSFNNKYEYTGKIVKMEDHMYPDITYNKDEEGKGTFTCTLGDRTIKYEFENDYLIGIKDTEKIVLADYDNDSYLIKLKTYNEKAKSFGEGIAAVEENSNGFIYTASIDLEVPGFRYPKSLDDNNYYKLDTEAKKIHYSQQGKGFDCK